MQKIQITAVILALLVGCAPLTHEDLTGDELDGDDTADAGPLGPSALGEPDAASSDAPFDVADAGALSTDAGVVGSSDAGTSKDAGNVADAAVTTDGAVADGGSVQVDSGAQQPAVTIVWAKHHVASTNLGGVTTQPYHRARFSISVNGNTLNADTPFYPTGWTGTSTIALNEAQRGVLRATFDCSVQATIQWGSCASSGCASLETGAVWETARPACSVTLPATLPLSLRVTISRLGADSIHETWEVVTP